MEVGCCRGTIRVYQGQLQRHILWRMLMMIHSVLPRFSLSTSSRQKTKPLLLPKQTQLSASCNMITYIPSPNQLFVHILITITSYLTKWRAYLGEDTAAMAEEAQAEAIFDYEDVTNSSFLSFFLWSVCVVMQCRVCLWSMTMKMC